MITCDFPAFFHALWCYDPFPWQTMLAERAAAGTWPEVLDLPTAAGKTACIDVALYALAAQAELPVEERTAPRRIWFVVDRRIVVDEAHTRARAIAKATRGGERQAATGDRGSAARRRRTETEPAVGRAAARRRAAR
jgi:CRISPR-associated endonuclease/helicase Cas3